MRDVTHFLCAGFTKLLLVCASLTPAFIICQTEGASVAVLCVACAGSAFLLGGLSSYDAGFSAGHAKGVRDLDGLLEEALKKVVRRG